MTDLSTPGRFFGHVTFTVKARMGSDYVAKNVQIDAYSDTGTERDFYDFRAPEGNTVIITVDADLNVVVVDTDSGETVFTGQFPEGSTQHLGREVGKIVAAHL